MRGSIIETPKPSRFLNEFYGKTNKPDERIEALKKWLAAVAPIDTRFYRAIIGKQADLSPEYASLELGEALIQKRQKRVKPSKF